MSDKRNYQCDDCGQRFTAVEYNMHTCHPAPAPTHTSANDVQPCRADCNGVPCQLPAGHAGLHDDGIPF